MKFILITLTCSLLIFSLSGNYNESFSDPWGADSELAQPQFPHAHPSKITRTRAACTAMIRFYQRYISPINGPRSSFYPTSSQYTLEAIQEHGLFCGIALGCDRLLRENSESWIYKRTDEYGIERKLDPIR